MSFRHFPAAKLSKQLKQRKRCCVAKNLEPWSCHCSWGCEMCYATHRCKRCHAYFGHKAVEVIKAEPPPLPFWKRWFK